MLDEITHLCLFIKQVVLINLVAGLGLFLSRMANTAIGNIDLYCFVHYLYVYLNFSTDINIAPKSILYPHFEITNTRKIKIYTKL